MNELPIHCSVTVVVEHEGRYLMTLEERGQPRGPVWYFPSGAVEPGESLAEAARREVLEETGWACAPERIVRVNHGTFRDRPGLFWWRYVVLARPVGDEPLAASEADVLEVAWTTREDIGRLRLRAADAPELAQLARSGGGLDLRQAVLAPEGTLEGFFA